MTRRMTMMEATDLIETVFEVGPDAIQTGLVEVTVGDMQVGQARADIESYLATVPGDIDPDTITIIPDVVEGSTIPAVVIHVRTA